jgi:hypothetical protein
MSQNVFYHNYLTGAQCELYMGDKLIDEAVEVEFRYSAEPIPRYGYASYHFNAVSYSRVIVFGSLILNHVSNIALLKLINSFKSSKDNIAEAIETEISVLTPEVHTLGLSENDRQDVVVNNSTDGKIIIDDAYMKSLIRAYWDDETARYLGAPPRPEFTQGPFDLKIKDYIIGSEKIESQEPMIKEIKNCFLSTKASFRRVDDSPVIEAYQFIAQTII